MRLKKKLIRQGVPLSCLEINIRCNSFGDESNYFENDGMLVTSVYRRNFNTLSTSLSDYNRNALK